jgi:hypothetical protein
VIHLANKSPMKKFFAVFICVSIVAARAALPQPDLLMQIHFAGPQKISAAANFSAFTNEFCSAEAQALRAQTANKLSVALANLFQQKLNARVVNGAAKLRPLFDDLQNSEWFLEARITPDNQPELAIAIKLDATREKIWRANLPTFFTNAKTRAYFKTEKGWLIFDCGFDAPNLANTLPQQIPDAGTNWLTADFNWPRLGFWFSQLKDLNLPETQFAVSAPDDNFRVNGKIFFRQNLAIALEPWRVPTNTLHQPFASFTAVRGFANWLATQAWARPYEISPPPNQLFLWALPQMSFQVFAAIPVSDSANALNQFYARLQPIFNSENANDSFIAPLTLELTNDEIGFRGMPFIAPNLDAVNERAGQFLIASAFPNTPRSKPLPPELFTRLAEKNLVFYHWEITATRMAPLLQLTQFGLLLTWRDQLSADSASFKWIMKIGPTLGNNVTEIFQTAPDQMTFTRKAPGIFTAFELFALANWLEAKNFPGCDLKMPPRSNKFKKTQHKNSSAPAPASAH